MDIHLAGFKTLWSLGQNTPMSLDVLLQHLKAAGVTSVSSGAQESETDLTATEIQSLHLTAHRAGLSTVAKLELSGPTQGAGEPVWDTYVKRAQILNGLATPGFGPTLTAVSIEVAPESFVTPTEFMRAIALARLAIPAVNTIVADLLRIPTLSQAKGMGAGKQYHGAEKIAALSLHYGATDLGSLDVEQVSPINVLKQIRASGFVPSFRTQRVAESTPKTHENTGLLIDGLRHVPSLA
jgi:hypothetical protein